MSLDRGVRVAVCSAVILMIEAMEESMVSGIESEIATARCQKAMSGATRAMSVRTSYLDDGNDIDDDIHVITQCLGRCMHALSVRVVNEKDWIALCKELRGLLVDMISNEGIDSAELEEAQRLASPFG